MYKYEIIIYWSQEDDAFIAEVPELPGCIAHGQTAEQALANAHQAIELWIWNGQRIWRPHPRAQRAALAVCLRARPQKPLLDADTFSTTSLSHQGRGAFSNAL
ncbi:type II toxin-antitoxin system HicB family antitoxin [uncultured Meiothermus sp.]|uniref:type II toxin-antitoxin system HicB family antitoxin n=1 Tax=uncultured Meiothermus sp. TaxID=157471 RepID=UPI00345215DE